MPNRLFVNEILSIGLVGKGDNPASEVLIWKSRTETGAERLARLNQSLADLNQRIERLNKRRANAQASELERNPMTDKEPQSLNELAKAKLDVFARKQQFEGEIAGKYGFLSTPREEMVVKIKAKWWATPDGLAVKDLVREHGGDPVDLTTIAKSHSEAYAALARLDG